MLFKDQKIGPQADEKRPSSLTGTAAESQRPASFIGHTVRLEGQIISEDDLTIEGRFKGDLNVKKNLFVGIEGYVEADITAAAVTVAGHVRGSVRAEGKVKILDSGVMDGILDAPKLIIADGGQLRGQVNRTER